MSINMVLSQDQFEQVSDNIYSGEVRSYSGRGMGGEQCIAYVPSEYSSERPELFAIQVAMMVARDQRDDDDDSEVDIYELMDALDELGGMSSDSMGYSQVFYYPNIKLGEGVGE